MKIIINGNHREKLESALSAAQAHCTARTLDCDDIEYKLERVTARLGIAKAAMKGTRLTYTGAQHFPKAYQHTPESTHFTAEHNGRFWVVTSITRAECPNRQDDCSLTLSDSAKEAILRAHESFQA